MRTKVLMCLVASLAMFFLLLPAAHADTVQLTLVAGGANNGCTDLCDPYELLVSAPNSGANATGTDVWMNCDDYSDNISVNSYWNADVISGAGALAGTLMSSHNGWSESKADFVYDEKGYIEAHYNSANNPAYTLAIWFLFDPTNTGILNPVDNGNTAEGNILTAAFNAATADGGTFLTYRSSLVIYSPVNNGYPGNGGNTPQEFDRRIPDGGMTLMLLGGVLVGLETLRRKLRV